MEQLEQNHATLREDMAHMKAQMGQLMDVLQNLARGHEEMRPANQRDVAATNPILTVPTGPMGGTCPIEGGPAHQNTTQTFHIPVQGDPQIEMDEHPESFYDAYGPLPAEVEKKFRVLEERMKVMEGFGTFGLEAADMYLVPGVKIPAKFKVPVFEKYKRDSCLLTHVRSYCRKMAAYSDDEKLLMHFFQDSLNGASLEWYMHLERTHVRTWRELAETFLKHYQYNTVMMLNRAQLQNLTQKTEESFKEYAQRWRDLAAGVQPLILKKELVDMFMSKL